MKTFLLTPTKWSLFNQVSPYDHYLFRMVIIYSE